MKYWFNEDDFKKYIEKLNVVSEEIWLPVLELYSYYSNWKLKDKYTFEYGKYFVSNYGRFMSKNKIVYNKPDSKNDIIYSLDGKRFKLHQIVLQTFDPSGIKDYYTVDHIDRTNRLNNSLDNLRWGDRKIQYENRNNTTYKYKKVLCKQNGKIYNSCQEAELDLSLVKNTVSRVARGERKSIHGYEFEYI